MAVAFNGFPRFYSIPCKRHWSLILSSMVDFYTGIYQFQAEVYFRNLWNMHQCSIYTVFTRWLVRQDQTAKETKRRMIIHRFLLFLQVLHDRNRHKSKSQQFEKQNYFTMVMVPSSIIRRSVCSGNVLHYYVQ